MHKLTAIVLLVLLYGTSQAQTVVDSLINASSFPVIPGYITSSLSALDTSTLRLLYTYHRDSTGNTRRYFLKPENVDAALNVDEDASFYHQACCPIDSNEILLLPKVHTAYFAARTFRRKSEKYRHINFFVDHFIKNYADSSWSTSDHRIKMKLFDGDALLKTWDFGPTYGTGKRERWISTGQNQISSVLNIQPWSHYNPKNYRYCLEVYYGGVRLQHFAERIGFRDIRVENGEVLINNASLNFKTLAIDPTVFEYGINADSYLRNIKVHNFNTIILQGRGTKEIFNFCDLAGLNVVQDINHTVFRSLPDLLEYYMCFKEHPSLIGWRDTGLNSSWTSILTRLDKQRPIIRNIQSYPVTENWNESDSTFLFRIKHKHQTFRFYYVPANSLLSIAQNEPFPCLDILSVRWAFKNRDSVVERGQINEIHWHNNAAEVKLNTRDERSESAESSFEFELVVNKDHFPYKQGDVIAVSKLSNVIKAGRLIYQVDY